MPAVDDQRVWYPEMLEDLGEQWREGLEFEELIALRDTLDATLQRIRAEQHFRAPLVRCPECRRMVEGEGVHVTVRAMILALLRHEIAAPEPVYALEKSWARYRKQKNLDPQGKPAAAPATGCSHV
jgi:hypothetical protein